LPAPPLLTFKLPLFPLVRLKPPAYGADLTAVTLHEPPLSVQPPNVHAETLSGNGSPASAVVLPVIVDSVQATVPNDIFMLALPALAEIAVLAG